MPVSFKAAQSLTILTPFLILKELLAHWLSLFTQDHSVVVAQGFNASLCSNWKKKKINITQNFMASG